MTKDKEFPLDVAELGAAILKYLLKRAAKKNGKWVDCSKKERNKEMEENVNPEVEMTRKMVQRMKNEGQIVRPVANALLESLGYKPSDEEPPKLKCKKPVYLLEAPAMEKMTKAELIKWIQSTMHEAVVLKEETDDVRALARHYRGFVGAEDLSAGQLYRMEVVARDDDLKSTREVIRSFFHLNETQTDNLGNSAADMAAMMRNRFVNFITGMRRVKGYLLFLANAMENDDDMCSPRFNTYIEMVKVAEMLMNHTFANKGKIDFKGE